MVCFTSLSDNYRSILYHAEDRLTLQLIIRLGGVITRGDRVANVDLRPRAVDEHNLWIDDTVPGELAKSTWQGTILIHRESTPRRLHQGVEVDRLLYLTLVTVGRLLDVKSLLEGFAPLHSLAQLPEAD